MSDRRVVITGMGIVSACGMGYEPLWEMALAGRSAIRELSLLTSNGSPIRVGGEVPGFKPEEYVKVRKSLKVMSRDIQLAVASSVLAMQDAGLASGGFEPIRAGITLGASLINNDLDELGAAIRESLDPEGNFQIRKFGREGIRALYPLWLLKYLPNMPACHISILHGFKGPSNTLMTSSTGGIQAVGEACRVIERDDADVMLAGACDSKVNPLGLSRLYLMGILSERNHIPSQVYRPFDRRRDGIVVGEGAGIFILEERNHALKRGARIYGEILGYSGISGSRERSIKNVFERAQTDLNDIDFIHANGSGIPEEDILEAQSLTRVFGSGRNTPVVASKSLAGHWVDAAGSLELSIALLALQRAVLPPIANLEEPDPECELNFVTEKPNPMNAHRFLLHSFGLGGQSAALIVGQEK